MQIITIPFDGTNLDLSQIPIITDSNAIWNLQITSIPPIPPNLFTVNIFYLDQSSDKKVLKNSVVNMQSLETNVTIIDDQTVHMTFLLYFCNSQKVVNQDVDVIIRR